MKVTATDKFKDYRNIVLGLEKKDYRKLQAGKEVEISKEKFIKYPEIWVEVKKDG